MLDRCLRSILSNRPAEIILVDGLSTDDSILVAQEHGVVVVSDEGKGLGYARHLGVVTASQPYVAFIDTDVLLPEVDTLPSMLAELQHTGVTGLHAQILGTQVSNYWEWAQDTHFRLTFNRPGPRNAIGCVAALFRREILLEHHPDEYFTGASEDGDLSLRLRRVGHQLAVSHRGVLHDHRADFRSFLRQRVWYGRGNGRLAWRHQAPWLLVGPLAFLAGGALLAIRHRLPLLVPYLVIHTICVLLGESIEYGDLAVRAAAGGRHARSGGPRQVNLSDLKVRLPRGGRRYGLDRLSSSAHVGAFLARQRTPSEMETPPDTRA